MAPQQHRGAPEAKMEAPIGHVWGLPEPFGESSGAHGSQQGPKSGSKWEPKVAQDR